MGPIFEQANASYQRLHRAVLIGASQSQLSEVEPGDGEIHGVMRAFIEFNSLVVPTLGHDVVAPTGFNGAECVTCSRDGLGLPDTLRKLARALVPPHGVIDITLRFGYASKSEVVAYQAGPVS
jgi:hypothetical protein